MKNLLQIFVLIFFTFSNISAQEFAFGIKGGVNYNSIGDLDHYGTARGGSPIDPLGDVLYKADKGTGIQYGVFFMVDFGRFFVRPEVNFSSLKNSYALAKNTSDWSANKMDIPILIGVHVYKPISMYVGPVFSSISNLKLKGVDSPNPLIFDKNATGINAGILIEYNRFSLDVRYEYGITAVKDQRIDMDKINYGTNIAHLLEYNPSLFSINLNIKLFGFNSTSDGSVQKKRSSFFDWRNHKNL